MLEQFKLDLKLHKNSFAYVLLAEGFSLIVGFLLLLLILSWDEEDTWVCVGTVMAMTIGIIITVLFGALSYSTEFQLALAMGRTRCAFMVSYILRSVLTMLVGYIMLLACYRLEMTVYPLLFPGMENEQEFFFLTDWRFVLPTVLGLPVIGMFIGSLHAAFGKKGLWAFYVVWLFGCFILPRVFAEHSGTGILDQAAFGVRRFALAVPTAGWIAIVSAAVIGMTATTVILGKKQTVRL